MVISLDFRAAAATLLASFLILAPPTRGHAQAAAPEALELRLQRIEARLEAQERQLAAQERLIAEQRRELASLRSEPEVDLAATRAGRAASEAADGQLQRTASQAQPTGGAVVRAAVEDQVPNAVTEGLPNRPVGAAPPPTGQVIAALPDQVAVLTPPGQFILDPSIEYSRSSSNRLVFRGVEIVSGIQLGVIEANDADRDTAVATGAFRYGLSRRLEIEGRLPYVRRHDRVTTVAQQDETVSRTMTLRGDHIGDAEFAARYQLTAGRDGAPIFVGSARVKTPTGVGPYDVAYDQFGVATELATGSGFWAAEAGVTMLYPSDPAVIFGGLTYLHNFARNIDKTIGGVAVGRVEPGDSIGASVGFGLALNPRFSFSLGYGHSYILATNTELGTTRQSSNPLQVGSILMGWSFRLTDRLTLSNNFEFGVTSDAPDMRAVLRLPIRF